MRVDRDPAVNQDPIALLVPMLLQEPARLAGWALPGLATSPGTGRFWITIGCVAILAWRLGAPLAFTLRRSLRARTHRRSG